MPSLFFLLLERPDHTEARRRDCGVRLRGLSTHPWPRGGPQPQHPLPFTAWAGALMKELQEMRGRAARSPGLTGNFARENHTPSIYRVCSSLSYYS